MISLAHYLVLSMVLFGMGLAIMAVKRQTLGICIGAEFIVSAANLNLIAFSRDGVGGLDGQTAALLFIVLAGSQVLILLPILLTCFHTPNR
jgi:NADH-quinone oxidoreductase subunit K